MKTTEDTLGVSTAMHIYHRGLVLALFSIRFMIEFTTKRRGVLVSEDIYTVDQMVHLFNSSTVLRDILTTNESKLLKCDIGEWPDQIMTEMSWYSESCGCLLWAVDELKEFPPFDQPFGYEIFNTYFHGMRHIEWAIPLTHKRVYLREKEEIFRVKKASELLFQRCLCANNTRNKGTRVPLKRYDDIFHFSQVNLPVGTSGDLVMFGQEFCDLSENEERVLFPVATSRAHAFRWVTNPNVIWDQVSLEPLYTLPEV